MKFSFLELSTEEHRSSLILRITKKIKTAKISKGSIAKYTGDPFILCDLLEIERCFIVKNNYRCYLTYRL